MKIALCLEPPLQLQGGVSVLVQALAEGLRGKYGIVLVSPDSEKEFAAANSGSLFVEHIFWNPEKLSAASSKALAEKLSRAGVDLAHFHGGNFGWGNRFPGVSPIPYVRRRGIRVCVTDHFVATTLEGFCGPHKPLWFKLLLFPVATASKLHDLMCTDFEICVSQHDYRMMTRRYLPLQNRFQQIYHSRVRAGSIKPDNEPRRKIILTVGHLARRKGQEFLAEAFCNIANDFPDWELWIAGPALENETPRRIQQFAANINVSDRVKLLGERLDAVELMKQAAIYVQPSLLEPLGLALQEAMFAGCACIGSRVGGIPELICNNSVGALVEAGNVGELATQLRRLMNSPDDRQKLGRAAACSMNERGMTWENMIQQHLKIYEAMLPAHRK
ncbi:MAG TPA: glycosyltransferase family 4 protein [Candidatus Baltobacteraceae bacterium]|nr:glycosyltransferase family 4 protein [Candidatus Baltobacteraceae bacterium]